MNVFGWLFGRRQAPLAAPSEAHSVMLGDETRPLVRGRDGWIDPPEVHHFSAPTPRPDQFARREMLYVVIRESMMRAGILSAAYKFKVLSLDRKGRRFLVMMGGIVLHPRRMRWTPLFFHMEQVGLRAVLIEEGTLHAHLVARLRQILARFDVQLLAVFRSADEPH